MEQLLITALQYYLYQLERLQLQFHCLIGSVTADVFIKKTVDLDLDRVAHKGDIF